MLNIRFLWVSTVDMLDLFKGKDVIIKTRDGWYFGLIVDLDDKGVLVLRRARITWVSRDKITAVWTNSKRSFELIASKIAVGDNSG